MTKTAKDEIAKLRALDVPALVTRFEELHGKSPRSKHRAWLLRRCAHQIQVAHCGGLSEVARERLAELMSAIELATEEPRAKSGSLKRSHPGVIAAGTTLTRAWRGKSIVVRALESGFEYDGAIYKSLSAVAKAVTGSHWNGRLFFGLATRKPT